MIFDSGAKACTHSTSNEVSRPQPISGVLDSPSRYTISSLAGSKSNPLLKILRSFSIVGLP